MTINITTLLTNQVNNHSLYHQCNWHDTTNFYSEDDYCTGYRNVSHCQQQSLTQGYDHPDDHALSTYEMTPGFKPFTVTSCDITCNNYCIMNNQIYCYFTLHLLYYLKLKMIVDQPREKWLFWMLFNLASKFSWKWKNWMVIIFSGSTKKLYEFATAYFASWWQEEKQANSNKQDREKKDWKVSAEYM